MSSYEILPNILITGTPCVGKSYLCKRLADNIKFRWLDCSKLALENDFLEDFDDELNCPILDEDKLLDYMEPIMAKGGNIVEYHSCEFFPERWFHAVFVVTCSNTVLYDRLKQRGYHDEKLKSNIECEIFNTILMEARDAYDNDIIYELKCDTEEDGEKSIETITDWVNKWKN